MTIVTGYQHDTFTSRIDSLIKSIENKNLINTAAKDSITELQEALNTLNSLFLESHLISEKLRLLANEYKQRQHAARVKLRLCRSKYVKHSS
jgi:hypothetical protein